MNGGNLPEVGLRYAILGVLTSAEDGVHGGGVKGELERLFSESWKIHKSNVYRALESLLADGLVQREETGSKPYDKKPYWITDRGRKHLDHWLEHMPLANTLLSRQETIAIAICFIRPHWVGELRSLVASHRRDLVERCAQLARLGRAVGDVGLGGFPGSALIQEAADMGLRYQMAWLQRVEEELDRHFGNAVRR